MCVRPCADLSAFVLLVALIFMVASGCAQAQDESGLVGHASPTVKVAAVQCSSDLGAVEQNRAKLTALVREAAAAGAKIIVLPETAVTGYVSQDLRHNWHLPGRPLEATFRGRDPAAAAETVPGPSTDHFCALAKELQIYLTIPLLERVDSEIAGFALPTNDSPSSQADQVADPRNGPRYFNTVCLADPQGQLVAHYRKLNPWPYPEKSWATPG